MSQTKAQLLDNIKDNVQLDARNSLRFADTDSSHYVAFKAPATVSSNVTWTLPAADGSANYVLATDGSGTLSWIADPAGQWTTSGSNIYFTGGNVGIGDSSPSNPLSVTGASSFDGDVTFTGASYNVTWDKSADDLIFNDNAKAVFGTSSDGVEIYHNGSASWIADTGTGGLNILSNLLWLGNAAGSETFIQGTENGEVSLWYDNGEKLNTVTDGVNITGSLQFGDDTNTYLQRSAADTLQIVTGGTAALTVDASQEVGIGTTSPSTPLHVVGTIHGSTNIGIRTTSPSSNLHVHQDDSDKSIAQFTNTATGTGVGDGFQIGLASSEDGLLNMKESKSIFFKTADSDAMTIDSSQRVGIGTTSPTGIHNLAKVLEISGGDGGDLVIGNSVSTNIGAGAHIGSIAFKNIDNSTGSSPHYAGIRCEAADTSGNMDLRFYTGIANLEADTPQVYINSTGHLGVGTTTPDQLLHIADAVNPVIRLENTDASLANNQLIGGIEWEKQDASGAGVGICGAVRLYSDDQYGARTYLSLSTRHTSTGGSAVATESLRIKSDGDVSIINGNLVVASGHGIDFSATANGSGTTTSELLDDYEYGSFTPTVGASTTNGTVAYSAQNGFYVKIGRLVQVYIDFTISSWSGASGLQRIHGLPFTKNELSGQSYYYEGVSPWYVVNNLTDSKPCYTGYLGDNAVFMNMYVGDTCQTDTGAPVNVTGRCSITFTYSTSS